MIGMGAEPDRLRDVIVPVFQGNTPAVIVTALVVVMFFTVLYLASLRAMEELCIDACNRAEICEIERVMKEKRGN